MGLFDRKKSLEISNYIIAIDKKVIARKGENLGQDMLDRLIEMQPLGIEDKQTIAETPLLSHFKILLDKDKYRFISNYGQKRDQLLEILAAVSLNKIIFEELAWMSRYEYHYRHSLVITLMVTRMALDLFRDATKVKEAASSALTHDFGITQVPQNILNKVSRLDDEEVKLVCEHPIYSYILLSYYCGDYRNINALVGYEHHEDLTGSGYPRGIIQKNVISQLVRIGDFYDALISARPFRPALQSDEALDVIAQEVGKGRLNPEAFALLTSYLGKTERIRPPLGAPANNRVLAQEEKHRVYKRINP